MGDATDAIAMQVIVSSGPVAPAPPVTGPDLERDAEYALAIVTKICRDVGPGLPATPEERARAMVIRDELARQLGPARVTIEELEVPPDAWLASVPASAALMAIGALLNVAAAHVAGAWALVVSASGLVVTVGALALFVAVFLLGRPLLDPLFPTRTSENVIGVVRAPGTREPRRLLIVSGHHDSALENTWIGLLGYASLAFGAIAALGMIVLLLMTIVQVAGAIAGRAAVFDAGTLGWITLGGFVVPSIVYGLFFNRGRKGGGTVPGAVDNLAASALVVAMARSLAANPSLVPPDTEIRFVSFGSEEAGLRGSTAYVARHRAELRRLDARVLNLETIADPEMGILTSDVQGTVVHAPGAVAAAVAAARRAGVPYQVKPAFLGVGTDAAPFSRAGIEATTLLPFRVPRQLIAFYHQKRDCPEVLCKDALVNALALSFEWIRAGGRA